MGKTTFALSIVDCAISTANKTVTFFSLEMAKDQLINHMINLRLNSYPQLIIDDLQLMQGNTSLTIDRPQEVASIVCPLKKIAADLQLTIIILSRPCHEAETRADCKPILCNLDNSSCPTDYLDIALFLYRYDYYNKNSKCPDTTELIVSKNDFGNTGTIFLNWSPNPIFQS